jgi:1-acyl-sn-glycerol-3-phosphate acyltransferase
MLRTGWFLLNLFVSTFWYGSLAVVSGLLRVPNRPGGVYDYCAREWSRSLLRAAGTDLEAVGTENLPKGHPVVYVSNHQSWFDIFALAGTLPGQMRFVAKKEMARIPLLGRAMRSAEHIFIDRQNRQAAFGAYEEAAKAIRAGLSAVVFAEGTRSRTGQIQTFKKGPFVLAIAAQVPVIPVYCAGTFTLLRKGSIRINPHPIALMFGKQIPTEGMVYDDREKLMKITRAAIEQLRVDSLQILT